MGLLARARSIPTGSGQKTSRGGLLALSRRFRLAPPPLTLRPAAVPQEEVEQARSGPERSLPPAVSAPPPLPPTDLRAALQALPEGVETPAQLFSALKSALPLSRAALLLFDPARSVYAPWAAAGLDETTMRRLRLPVDAGGHFDRLLAGEVLLLADPAEREPLRRYFSTREFATMESLLIVPFVHERRLLGMLLDTRSGADEALRDSLRAWAPEAARLLYRSRQQRIEAPPPLGVPGREELRERAQVAAREAAARGNRLALVRLSLQPLVGAVGERNPFADPFRVQEDVLRLLSAVFRPLGDAVPLGSAKALLLLSVPAEPDLPLLTAHLRAALRTLVPQLAADAPLELEETMRVCEASPEAAGTCLAELV